MHMGGARGREGMVAAPLAWRAHGGRERLGQGTIKKSAAARRCKGAARAGNVGERARPEGGSPAAGQ